MTDPAMTHLVLHGDDLAGEVDPRRAAAAPDGLLAAFAAYDDLAARFDVIISEGAGSPAEINLLDHDIVNLPLARRAHALLRKRKHKPDLRQVSARMLYELARPML